MSWLKTPRTQISAENSKTVLTQLPIKQRPKLKDINRIQKGKTESR